MDSVICYNFRSDRMRQISQAILYPEFEHFERAGGYKKVHYTGMTQYDNKFDQLGFNTVFAPKNIRNTLGEYVVHNGRTQARVAETEKYPHVTYFLDGGVEIDHPSIRKHLVPSPKVATYDIMPEMSALQVTDAAIAAIAQGVDLLVVNYANCDMVGQTGNFDATVQAVKVVDECCDRLVRAVLDTGGAAIVTADHGNAERMALDDGRPWTAHTTNRVPIVLASKEHKKCVLNAGILADVAPTILYLMGLEPPQEMTGQCLIATKEK
jgi:2,3-bisphosphoglycerate-independent phosphoglycerate mutase